MEQGRLFEVAPSAVSCTARWEHPMGWSVTITSHARPENGPTSVTEVYSDLTAAELLDVVSAVLAERLLLI